MAAPALGLPRFRLLVLLVAGACHGLTGCVTAPPSTQPTPPPRESVTAVPLHGRNLELHLLRPAAPSRPDVLVVYASGDGGWFGAAIDQWRQIARDGYAVAGFSARSFLRIERPPGAPLDPVRLAHEYRAMVDAAAPALGLPAATPVVLAGWSRGAAFSIIVAGERELADRVLGVVAFGLANGENLLVDEEDAGDDDSGATGPSARHFPFETYGAIARLPVRCAVIQATHDGYLPAAAARRLFGADTPVRRFYAVEAKNHRFSGGRAAFAEALSDAMAWVSSKSVVPGRGEGS